MKSNPIPAALLLALLCSVLPATAQSKDLVADIIAKLPAGVWEEYRRLNAEETRYAEWKDSDRMLALKLNQLAYVNKSRAAFHASPVILDILASRVANRMCREAGENGFSGHWNMRGEKPYQRWAFAGGMDHVSENAAARWSSASLEANDGDYVQYMNASHDSFMAEKAPNDGHKQTVIRKEHTGVGLGAAVVGKQFRYYEEYLDRYLAFGPVPSEPRTGDLTIKVKPLDAKKVVYAVVVYYEPLPAAMSVQQINAKSSYPDFTDQTVQDLWPWELKKGADGFWDVPLKLARTGSYYVQVYLDDKPFTGGSAGTEGKIQGSGLVLLVR